MCTQGCRGLGGQEVGDTALCCCVRTLVCQQQACSRQGCSLYFPLSSPLSLAQHDTDQSPVRRDSPVPSVCAAYQAEPEEAEAEVPQVSAHLAPTEPLFRSSCAWQPSRCLEPRVTHNWGGTRVSVVRRSGIQKGFFFDQPYRRV